jgi:hypothetical protein
MAAREGNNEVDMGQMGERDRNEQDCQDDED